MQIDPISSFTVRAAMNARQKLLDYYAYVNAVRMANSNYLQEVGEGLKRLEKEQASAQAFFKAYQKHSIHTKQ
jgi:hypothetical protein